MTRKTSQWLIALLACLYASAVLARVNVTVQILGVSAEVETNIRLFLSIEQQKDNALLSAARLRRLYKKSDEEIASAMQPFGYYRPKIKSELTQVTDGEWRATFTIDPGPPIRIAEFNLVLSDEIKQDPEIEALLKNIPLTKGDVFNHLQYENIKSSLARLAAERGFFRGHFTEHRIEINLDTYEVHVWLHYEGGPRYRFGDVSIEQNAIDPELLQRYIPFKKGTPYSLNQLIDTQQALNDSDFFRTVEVSPGKVPLDSDEIPVDIVLEPRTKHRYTFGIGYGTDTGARTKFGWEIPLLNSHGHQVKTEASVSQLGYSLTTHYIIPVFNPRTDQLIYSAGVVHEKTDVSENTLRTIGASLNRNLSEWRESVALNYQQEKFIIADVEGNSTLLIPSVNWSRIWGNNFIYALDGLRFDIGLRGANDKVVSDTSFYQVQGGLKGITSLNQNNRLIARGSLGGTWTDAFDDLPSSVRFFAGGSQSVRGYSYHSLGPKDANGNVIGGKYLMTGSVEFEHSFAGNWGMAVFYDAGNAMNNTTVKLERGAGFGFRWKTPIGPVRVDFASAISRDGHPWRLHITIGPDL
jgi:translocation and assembly module TamA